MAVGLLIDIPGGTQEQYDAVMEKLFGGPTPEQIPAGGIFHVAGPTASGWRVVDVWESEEAFGRFVEERLGRALEEVGVPRLEPQVFPVHNIFGRLEALAPSA